MHQFLRFLNNSIGRAIILALLLCLTASSAMGQEWGHFRGQINFDGDAPTPERLAPGQDVAYCGRHELFDESLIVGDDGGLQNVFVYLYRTRRNVQEVPIHPSYEEASDEALVLDNLKCRFEPHAFLLRTSQPLIAKNSDEIGHNASFQSRYNTRNAQIPAGDELELAFELSDNEPIRISCGSHAWMSSFVLIRDEPYAALTDSNGQFEIRNLPAGEWVFQFWHERTGTISELSKDGEVIVNSRGTMSIVIEPDQTTDLGRMTIAGSALSN